MTNIYGHTIPTKYRTIGQQSLHVNDLVILSWYCLFYPTKKIILPHVCKYVYIIFHYLVDKGHALIVNLKFETFWNLNSTCKHGKMWIKCERCGYKLSVFCPWVIRVLLTLNNKQFTRKWLNLYYSLSLALCTCQCKSPGLPSPGVDPGDSDIWKFLLSPHPHLYLLCQNLLYFLPHEVGISLF